MLEPLMLLEGHSKRLTAIPESASADPPSSPACYLVPIQEGGALCKDIPCNKHSHARTFHCIQAAWPPLEQMTPSSACSCMGTRFQCYHCSQTAQRPIQGLGAGKQPPGKCSPPAIAHVFAVPCLICRLSSGPLKAWEREPAVCSPPAIAHVLAAALQAAWLPAEDPAGLQPARSSSLPRLPLDRLARTGRDGAAPDSPLDLSAIRSGHAQLPDSQRSHRATHTLLTGEQTAPGALSGKGSMVKPPASLQQPVLPG